MNSKQTLELSHVTVHGTLSTSIAKPIIKPIGLTASLLPIPLAPQEEFGIPAFREGD